MILYMSHDSVNKYTDFNGIGINIDALGQVKLWLSSGKYDKQVLI